LAQMMRTTPCRRTTLHLTQIFLTDERTFTMTCLSTSWGWPANY
jgi:hypothetical protein